jgi:phospholipid/cholesterol/gamma-HCH transport system permease protein
MSGGCLWQPIWLAALCCAGQRDALTAIGVKPWSRMTTSLSALPPPVTPRPRGQGQRWPTNSVLDGFRRAATTVALIPSRGAATTGRGFAMLLQVFRYTFTDIPSLRFPMGEALVQAWNLFKVTATPALLMAIPFGALVTVVTSGLVNQVGATSLLGAASGVGVIRQGAPITAGLLMGGAAASAIASDFGARAIREELDAMRVLAVDPVRRLVTPRFWALVCIAPVLTIFIIVSGTATAFAMAVTFTEVTPGSFWMSFGTFAKIVDVYFAIGKSVIFAAIVVIVSSLRGMDAKGGPRGVADAVNSSVVLNVVCIVFMNLAITQLQTMFFPLAVA